MTEESKSAEADREGRAWTETRSRWNLTEVPSRAVRVNAAQETSCLQ